MPAADHESLVTGDRKIAWQTLAVDELPETEVIPAASDLPPESFWLSKDAEHDWFDRNAFYERKDSTRANSSSANLNQHANPNSNSNSNSQRFSGNLKSKASIIGLPKTQKNNFRGANRRANKPANVTLFPKRSDSVGKSTTPVEPGSPKVSCMGRVRSKRCRHRSNSRRRSGKPGEISRTGFASGFCSKVMCMFRSKKRLRKPSRSGSRKVAEVLIEEPVAVGPLRKSKSVTVKFRETSVGDEPAAAAPGLGGMRRFASGRQSGSWASEDFSQAVSGEFDRRVDRS